METLLLAASFGLIPAVIAKGKGKSFALWWLYGTAIWLVAMPHAILMKADTATLEAKQIASGGMRRCPYCAELIRAEARVCRYCGKENNATTTWGDRHMVPEPATKPPPKVRCVSCGYTLPPKALKPGGVVPCPHCGAENKLSPLAPSTRKVMDGIVVEE